jgi:hypothetical protein
LEQKKIVSEAHGRDKAQRKASKIAEASKKKSQRAKLRFDSIGELKSFSKDNNLSSK